MKTIVKFIVYNAFWFACAHSALGPYEIYSLFLPLIFLGLYWRDSQSNEKIYYFALAILGFTFDLIAQAIGWIELKTTFSPPIPFWLLSIWLLFSVVMGDLFRTFKDKTLILLILGAIFAPLSYSYGEKIKILKMANQSNYLVYSGFWMLFLNFGLWGYLKLKLKK
jgi:hypothetical protein